MQGTAGQWSRDAGPRKPTSSESSASDSVTMRCGAAAAPGLAAAAPCLAAPEPLLKGEGRMRRTLPCRAATQCLAQRYVHCKSLLTACICLSVPAGRKASHITASQFVSLWQGAAWLPVVSIIVC